MKELYNVSENQVSPLDDKIEDNVTSISNTDELNQITKDVLDSENQENENINEQETSESNCLALTIRKDYKLAILKNSFVATARLSFKVAISTLILNIIKLFF